MHVCVAIYLRGIDQKFNFGGTLGHRDLYLEFLFRLFKVFRLQAILHDAAGTVRAHSDKGSGYCYMTARGSNSCLFGPVNGLLFCLYVKLFLPPIFNPVEPWSSISCIVLDIDLADKDGIKEFGVLNDGKIQGYSLRPPKKYKPTKQAFWWTKNLHKIAWNSGCLHYSELSNIFPRAVNGEYYSKRTKKCKIHVNLLDKEVENWEDNGCPKVQDLVDEETWSYSSIHWDTRPHFTLQSARQNCLVTA